MPRLKPERERAEDRLMRLRVLALGLWLACLGLRAGEAGLPFLRNISPREYSGFFQNWALAQGPTGLVYAGNNLGVLEYDGVRWRLIPTERKTLARSLATDASGRVFVGAVGEFGYLVPGQDGATRYHSLLDLVPEEHRRFTDIWSIQIGNEEVWFQSFERIFRYAQGRIEVRPAVAPIQTCALVGGRLVVREEGRGLAVLNGTVFEPLPGGEFFATRRVRAILPMGEGTLLIATHEEGLFLLEAGQARPFPTEVDALLRQNLLFKAMKLPDGGLLLGTQRGGVLRIDAEGRLVQRLGKAEGLGNESVRAMMLDAEGGLWLALEDGLSRVEMDGPLSKFDERSGLQGTVMALHRHRGTLYAGTDRGLYRLAPNGTFEAIPGLAGSVLCFLPWEDRLLAGIYAGVVEIGKTRVDWVWKGTNGVFSLLRSAKDPSRLWVGTQNGLRSLRRQWAGWKEGAPVPGVVAAIRSQVEDADGRLWLGTSAQGVFSVLPGPEDSCQVQRFGVAEGLPSLNHTYVYRLRGELVVATHQGLHRRHGDRFEAHPGFAELFPEGARWLYAPREGADGRVWMHSCQEQRGLNEAGAAVFGADGKVRWSPESTARFAGAWVESILAEVNGVVWFGGPEGLFRLDTRRAKTYDHAFSTLLRRVTAGEGRTLNLAEQPRLRFADNRLRFEFGAPAFDQPSATRFQARLEGFERDWSPAGAEGYKDYTNLSPGSYLFRVRACNLYGVVGQEATFHFRVLPPFYRSWWAYLVYGLGGVGAFHLLSRWRTASLRKRNQELECKVAERTMDLAARNAELVAMDGTVKAINRETQMREVLHAILEQSLRQFPQAERGVVLIQDEQDGLFRAQAAIGFPPGALEGLAFSSEALLDRYIRRSEHLNQGVFRVQHPTASIGATQLSGHLLPAALLAMHLELDAQLAGYLLIEHPTDPEAFRKADLEKLSRFREHALTAVAKARLIDRLESLSGRLREGNEQKIRFMGIVAHDLRNPLNSIILASQMLQGEDDPELVAGTAQRITREGRDMSELIGRYLEVAAIEAGELRAEPEVIEVGGIARHVAERHEARAREKGLRLELEVPPSPVQAFADPRFLKEILDNLVGNALKFSPTGQAVQLRVFLREGSPCVSIADAGPGFTAEDRQLLFGRYVRLSARPTGGEKSTGLGLSIVKHMAEAMQAPLSLESEPGRGATFTLELPVAGR